MLWACVFEARVQAVSFAHVGVIVFTDGEPLVVFAFQYEDVGSLAEKRPLVGYGLTVM